MSEILCVTNRKLCREDFLVRVETIAACRPAGIILREKDLTPEEYQALAERVMEICGRYGTPCIFHSFVKAALALHASAIHLPLPILRQMTPAEKGQFKVIGASCHSIQDAVEAQELGCTYLTAGHVFDTDCKKGLPGRGLDFLRQVCQSVTIPVYAIGGVDEGNYRAVRACGAQGACLMSPFMLREDIPAMLGAMEEQT